VDGGNAWVVFRLAIIFSGGYIQQRLAGKAYPTAICHNFDRIMAINTRNIVLYTLAGLVISGCKPVETFFPHWAEKPEPVLSATPTPTPTPSPKPTPKPTPQPEKPSNSLSLTPSMRQEAILDIAQGYVGERESKGSNRSDNIDKWNKFTNVPMGSPYCASFISYVLYEAKIKNAPKTAWSPSMVARDNVPFSKIAPADVFGMYFSSKKRIAHVGFIKDPEYSSTMLQTTEANTSPQAGQGSASDRDGDGVWNKLRSKKLMRNSNNKYSRYWDY
jgi:hypothetical protein